MILVYLYGGRYSESWVRLTRVSITDYREPGFHLNITYRRSAALSVGDDV